MVFALTVADTHDGITDFELGRRTESRAEDDFGEQDERLLPGAGIVALELRNGVMEVRNRRVVSASTQSGEQVLDGLGSIGDLDVLMSQQIEYGEMTA